MYFRGNFIAVNHLTCITEGLGVGWDFNKQKKSWCNPTNIKYHFVKSLVFFYVLHESCHLKVCERRPGLLNGGLSETFS